MDVYVWNENYPADAAYGCDFLTRADRGDIFEEGPDGRVARREKILVTSVEIDFEGRICFGERTIRHLAHELGLVDGWRVDRVVEDSTALRNEIADLSQHLANALDQIDRLEQLERQPARDVFIAVDGSRHASQRAATEATAQALGVPVAVVQDAVPRPEPLPVPEVHV